MYFFCQYKFDNSLTKLQFQKSKHPDRLLFDKRITKMQTDYPGCTETPEAPSELCFQSQAGHGSSDMS